MERHDAWEILTEFTKLDRNVKHALSVEQVMRQAAREWGGDPAVWGTVGLLHDFDWEIHPTVETHPMEGEPLLRGRGVPEEVIHAVQCHAPHSGAVPGQLMDHMILACDELTGFVIACALVQPNKSLAELKVSSVRKKLKDKAFARSVDRDCIHLGIERIDADLEAHIGFTIAALKPIAGELGLNR
ncbi:MAG: HDIG domain-containing metalloprotein [Dehalococcoidia bacterium]